MVETVLVLLFLLFAFFALLQYADNLRAKLLCEYAAGRCARARTVGMNDFMIVKTARIATMAAAGPCRSDELYGEALSAYQLANRSGSYLECEDEAAAQAELDFDYWRNGRTEAVATLSGAKVEARVVQHRPQFFDLFAWVNGETAETDEDGNLKVNADLTGTAAIEAHYPVWMQ